MIETIKSAEFSECGTYRYLLRRDWDDTKKVAMCIGLNPSTANGTKNDPTINILIRSLDHLGFGGLRMLNLYAIISSKPEKIFEVADPQGLNDSWLKTTAFNVQEIIFCWGSFKQIEYRVKKVNEMFPNAKCFGKNKDGNPWHPSPLNRKMQAALKNQTLKLMPYA